MSYEDALEEYEYYGEQVAYLFDCECGECEICVGMAGGDK